MVLWGFPPYRLRSGRAAGHEDARALPAQEGPDLFDLWLPLTEQDVDSAEVVRCFTEYITCDATTATRAQFEANMAAKLDDALFVYDIAPLLRTGVAYDVHSAWDLVHESLVRLLLANPGNGIRLERPDSGSSDG